MSNADFVIMLEKRTVAFSASVIRFLREIPSGIETRNLREQVMRSATAIGANYREANRAESENDFSHKIAISAKEAAETEYWLLLFQDLYPEVKALKPVLVEAGNLTRLFDKIRRTMAMKRREQCGATTCT